jgi:hypothetical protein
VIYRFFLGALAKIRNQICQCTTIEGVHKAFVTSIRVQMRSTDTVELSKSKSAVLSQSKAGPFDGVGDKVALTHSVAEASVFDKNGTSVVDGVGGSSASLHISGSDTSPSMLLQPPPSPMPGELGCK